MMQQCCRCGNEVDVPAEVEAIANALGKPMCHGCLALHMATNKKEGPEPKVEQRPSKYQYTEDMDEISGFGGGYEQTCRNMVAAGMEWLDAHPKADPVFRGFKGIYGIISEDNPDAEALSKAVVAGADGDCTGAMHQATISHCLAIKRIGWDAYCAKMREKDGNGSS